MRAVLSAVAVLWAFGLCGTAIAASFEEDEDTPPPRMLLAPALPLPADGLYVANDTVPFLLQNSGPYVKLRFAGSDEIFYLSNEPAPLGGRVLKYDTGEVALKVSGWGGVTLYTEQVRSGMPAEREGDIAEFNPLPMRARDIRQFAAALAQELLIKSDLAIGFTADWADLSKRDAASDERRTLASDAMRNATYAILKLARQGMHSALDKGLHIIRVLQAPKPEVRLQRGVLTVSYAPQEGSSGRPSSLAIALSLHARL